MKKINFEILLPYLLSLSVVGLVLVSIFRKNKAASLLTTGIKAEGTITHLEYNASQSRDSIKLMDKVTVEFTTKSSQTITAEINQDFASFYTGQYSIGEKVELYYDPARPAEFYVTTGQSETNSRLGIAIAGVVLSAIGLYLLYRH